MPDVTRIIEQTATESIFNDDWLIKDSPTNGTTKIQPSVLKAWINDGMATDEELETAVDDTIAKLSAVGSASGAIASFDDGSDLPMPKLEVAIEPQQDLHGYDAPWVGGSGKNKLPMTVESIKSKNTSGTWNNNVYTKNNMTFEILTDAANNVTGIKVNGTRNVSSPVYFTIGTFDFAANETYKVNGGVDLPSPIPVYFAVNGGVTVISSADYTQTFTSDTTKDVIIVVERTQQISNVIFRPMIRLSTESDSTYTPYSNICPISGWDEANVVVSPLNINPLYNGQIYGDGRWVENSARLTNVQTAQSNTYFLKAGTYTLDYDKLNSNAPSLLECSLLTKDDNYTLIDNFANAWNSLPFTFTLTQDGYLYFTVRKDSSTILTPSDYKAKILGQTYTVDLDGTRYGGTLDVVSGELTVDRAYVDLGTLYWSYSTADVRFFTTNIKDIKKVMDATIVMNGLCSHYDIVAYQYVHKSTALDGVMGLFSTSTTNYLAIKDTRYTDATSFKTAMDGVQLVYELATPLTIQLTPTQVKSLLGVNNIWADTGAILDAEYIRDMTTIINSLIARIEALENQ